MKKILPLLSVLVFAIITISVFLISKKIQDNQYSPSTAAAASQNVRSNGKTQEITITAKGGYTPRKTYASANIPTVLTVKTNSTFDCSASLVIPSLGYRNNLPSSGEVQINIPPQKPGTSLKGLCSMGMYSFTINFN